MVQVLDKLDLVVLLSLNILLQCKDIYGSLELILFQIWGNLGGEKLHQLIIT